MRKWKLAKEHKFIKDSSGGPEHFKYTIFPKGAVITEIPNGDLSYHQRKSLQSEKERGRIFICAYDPENLMLRYWRVRDLERVIPERKQFAPKRNK